jgi:predicted phosphoribosyltransferase
VVELVGPPPGYIEAAEARELREIKRRRRLYRGGRAMPGRP